MTHLCEKEKKREKKWQSYENFFLNFYMLKIASNNKPAHLTVEKSFCRVFHILYIHVSSSNIIHISGRIEIDSCFSFNCHCHVI